jgi:hypothetical protein
MVAERWRSVADDLAPGEGRWTMVDESLSSTGSPDIVTAPARGLRGTRRGREA